MVEAAVDRDQILAVLEGVISAFLVGFWRAHTLNEIEAGAGPLECEVCRQRADGAVRCLDGLSGWVADRAGVPEYSGAVMEEIVVHAVMRGRHPRDPSDEWIAAHLWGEDGAHERCAGWEAGASREEILRVLELSERCVWKKRRR